ncbi:lipoate--protein ligase [Ihubacter sp. rT4E-8]|uniref:lipoate--protein ligase n=1 Tax=Ihubacter sp. rT4E-8 TaxID=3242369 RepID=UPI003CF5FC4E
MRVIVEKSADPYHNLAMEEVLLDQATEDTVYLWRNRPSVIVGRHQNTDAEVNREYVTTRNISVVRRLTGGGAVYHDLGNINLSFFATGGDFDFHISKCVRLITEFLVSLGVSAVWTGRNDICVKDKENNLLKIAGTAQTLRNERGIFHSCLLFDTDREAMAYALTPPTDKLKSKGVASVRSRTANLKEISDCFRNISSDVFFYQVCEHFRQLCDREGAEKGLEEAALALMERKYLTWEWNYGRNPDGNIKNARRFPIGRVELSMSVCRGRIKECRFNGDYLTDFDLEQIAGVLCGQPFDASQIERILAEFDIENIFHVEDRSEFQDFLLGRR